MRKMACMSRPLALADPVPLTVAMLDREIVYAVHPLCRSSTLAHPITRVPDPPPRRAAGEAESMAQPTPSVLEQKFADVFRAGHPASLRCSSLTYAQ